MVVETCRSSTLGLTTEEQEYIMAAANVRLPRGWQIAFETTDDAEAYARIVAPWNPDASAFLIDREYHGVVLTDNITNDTITMHVMGHVHDAIEHIAAVVTPLRSADRGCGVGALVGFPYKEDGLCDPESDRNLLESMVSKHPRSAFPDNRNTREAVLLLLLRAIVWPRVLVQWCRTRLGMRSE